MSRESFCWLTMQMIKWLSEVDFFFFVMKRLLVQTDSNQSSSILYVKVLRVNNFEQIDKLMLFSQVETQLLKLLRGGHLARLGGMRAREGPFARPLLRIRKDELKTYLCSENQQWMEDATNALPIYKRNRIRLELVPLLVDLLGGEKTLYARSQEIAEQSLQLSSLLEDFCLQFPEHALRFPSENAPRSLNVSSFQEFPEMVRYEFIWRFVANACGAKLSHSAVQGILDAIGKPLSSRPFTLLRLGSGWELIHRGSQLVVQHEERVWQTMDLV